MKIKKTNIIYIIAWVLLIGVAIFFFPKSTSTCGALEDGDSCTRRTCMGINIIEWHTPPDSKCIGIDLGTESYFEPN